MAQTGYTPAPQRASFDEDHDLGNPLGTSVPPKGRHGSQLFRPWMASPVWFLCTVVSTLILITQTYREYSGRSPLYPGDTYATGQPTEFNKVKSSIELEKRRFTSAIRSRPDGSLFTAWDPDEPRYTRSGGSYEEVDAAWEDLLRGRYVRLTDAEIDWINADSLEQLTPISNLSWLDPGTYGGPDMLHSLHCLNGLRMHLDLEHYKDHIKIPEEYRMMHIDHCIDQLRQAVICHGDMTPVTLKPVVRPDGHVWALLGETEFTHTCRNGHDLREWWWNRGDETGRLEMLKVVT